MPKQLAPGIIRWNRYKAAKALGTHTDAQWQALLVEFNNRCVRCGSTERIQKDHIIALYQQGSDRISNIQPLCQFCNVSKGGETKNWKRIRRRHGFSIHLFDNSVARAKREASKRWKATQA